MRRFITRRLLVGATLLWFLATLTFALVQIAPGDPIDYYSDPRIPPEQVANLKASFGLDDSIWTQYVRWLRGVAVGDWGISFNFHEPPMDVILRVLPATSLLAFAALALGYGIGLGAGFWAGVSPNSLADRALRLASLTVYSLPTFWLGLMLILLFSGTLRMAPGSGMRSAFADDLALGAQVLDVMAHLALPALTLALPIATVVARLLRSSLLDVLQQDYIRNARSRGLSESRVLLRHALKNCLGPLVQLLGLQLPALLGGALMVEYVFSWPGLGALAIDAIEARDYPLVLASTVFTGTLVILGSLAADLIHAWIDPRVRDGVLS